MIEGLSLLLAFGAGAALGLLYFGGLWWTVRRGLASPRPALWFALSLPLRLGLTLAGFYAIAAGHWLRLPACLLGFVAMRLIIARFFRIAPRS